MKKIQFAFVLALLGPLVWGGLLFFRSPLAYATEVRTSKKINPAVSRKAKKKVTPGLPFWVKRVGGAVSEFSVSKNGRTILVATNPDSEVEGSVSGYQLSKFDKSGHLVWQRRQSAPVKELDVSWDGSFSVVSNYQNQLMALNDQGQVLWSVEDLCKPVILNPAQKIICYHDDDNDPKVGFVVYDWKGHRLSSFPVEKDILALKLSKDQRHLAIGLAGGQVLLFSPELKPLWTQTISGEVVDLAVSSGESPWVAVLYRSDQDPKAQRVARFDVHGRTAPVLTPSAPIKQVEVSSDGKSIFYYGNSSSGEVYGRLVAGESGASSTLGAWRKGEPVPSEFSTALTLSLDRVFIGVESSAGFVRQGHLLGFTYEGEMKLDLPLPLAQNAHIYQLQWAEEGAFLVVALDDGQILGIPLGEQKKLASP
ncbi:MAG: hypothetical protein ACO3A2_07740 [Bdellovibrionia bacterium]